MKERSKLAIILTARVLGPELGLALLLAGPALSLHNMLVIHSVMGTKKTLVFVGLVVDGEVKSSGKIPKLGQIVGWLTTAASAS